MDMKEIGSRLRKSRAKEQVLNEIEKISRKKENMKSKLEEISSRKIAYGRRLWNSLHTNSIMEIFPRS